MKYILLILVIGLLIGYPFALYFYHPYAILSCTMFSKKGFILEKRASFWKNPSYTIFKMTEKDFMKYASVLEKNGEPFTKMPSSRMYCLPDEILFKFDNSDVVISEKHLRNRIYTIIYDKKDELLYVSDFYH